MSLLLYKGGTQILFRDLPKFLNFRKTFRASCWASKIIPSHKISVHVLVTELRKIIKNFKIWEWDKYPLKSFFSKTVSTIVITVPRSTSSPKIMKKDREILVFSVSWSWALFKVGDHQILENWKYKYWFQNIYIILLQQFMVPNFQNSWSSRGEKH